MLDQNGEQQMSVLSYKLKTEHNQSIEIRNKQPLSKSVQVYDQHDLIKDEKTGEI